MSTKPDWILTEHGCNTEHWVQVSEILAVDVGPYQWMLRMRGGSLEPITGRAWIENASRQLGIPLYREEVAPAATCGVTDV